MGGSLDAGETDYRDGELTTDSVLFRQSRGKLFRVLPLAAVLAGGSALLLVVGVRAADPIALLGGMFGLTFFGPALLILTWALVSPNYLAVDRHGLRLRLYNLEADISWDEVSEISGGAGWPSLTFHDCERAARTIRLGGFPPIGWLLQVPTGIVSLIIRRRIANLYPTTRRQLVNAFRANEGMFDFHYGLPTSLLEASSSDILRAMRKARGRSGA